MSQENTTSYSETFSANDLRVHSGGRVTIPAHKRKHYDATTDSRVDLEVDPESGEGFEAVDLRVDQRGKVTIPSRQRDKYGVEDGDDVDATIHVREHGE